MGVGLRRSQIRSDFIIFLTMLFRLVFQCCAARSMLIFVQRLRAAANESEFPLVSQLEK